MLQLLSKAICNLIIDYRRMFMPVHECELLKGKALLTTHLPVSLTNMLPRKTIFHKLRKYVKCWYHC